MSKIDEMIEETLRYSMLSEIYPDAYKKLADFAHAVVKEFAKELQETIDGISPSTDPELCDSANHEIDEFALCIPKAIDYTLKGFTAAAESEDVDG